MPRHLESRSTLLLCLLAAACVGSPTSIGEPDSDGASETGTATTTATTNPNPSASGPNSSGNDGTGDSGVDPTSGSTGVPPDPQTSTDSGDPGTSTGAPPAGAEILFVNFDGVTLGEGADDATADQSAVASTFGGMPLAPFGDGPKREATLAALAPLWAGTNVFVTDERPESGDYSMVVVTPTNPLGAGVAGLSGQDCGDTNPLSVGVVFGAEADPQSAELMAVVICHIGAHGYGLDHTVGTNIMSTAANPNATFANECVPTTNAACGGHEDFCPAGEQNSLAELAALFPPE